MTRTSPPTDDRGVSVAVNHVLAIGITTVLITTLLFGAGNVLEQQDDRATQNQLRTIGDRLANQVATAESLAERNGGSAVVRTDHPRRIVGDPYEIELVAGADCGFSTTGCLRLSMVGTGGTEIEKPVRVDAITESTVSGGPVAIVYDGDGAELVPASEEAAPGAGAPVPDQDDPSVAPIGGARGETRTQYDGSGSGSTSTTTASTGSAPSVDSLSASEQGNSAKIDFSGSVSDTDGNLDRVEITITDSGGTTVYSDTINSISGLSDTFSDTTNALSDGETYTVTVTVYDTDGNSDSASTTAST